MVTAASDVTSARRTSWDDEPTRVKGRNRRNEDSCQKDRPAGGSIWICGREAAALYSTGVFEAAWENQDPYMQILRESGFLPTGSIGLVNFCNITAGMNAEETERFLREKGAEICSR